MQTVKLRVLRASSDIADGVRDVGIGEAPFDLNIGLAVGGVKHREIGRCGLLARADVEGLGDASAACWMVSPSQLCQGLGSIAAECLTAQTGPNPWGQLHSAGNNRMAPF